MELKGQSRLHKREPPASFNRTFMELKVTGCGVPESRAQFQSHLYGIESCVSLLGCELGNVSIAPLWNWKWGFPCSPARLHGFNRTFMELKVIRQVGHALLAEFQSHLYGIERMLSTRQRRACRVSIAPLWNWKCGDVLPRRSISRFNRTFMELKVKTVKGAKMATGFQSHLYGIERCKYLCQDLRGSVSIAPLWNWKWRRACG